MSHSAEKLVTLNYTIFFSFVYCTDQTISPNHKLGMKMKAKSLNFCLVTIKK